MIRFIRKFSSAVNNCIAVTSSCRRDLKNNTIEANIGIYWGKNDELNAYMPFKPEDGSPNLVKVQLESVCMALKQVKSNYGLFKNYLRRFMNANYQK